ncbi:MAG: hypothetical protein ACRC1M_07865, partial [Methanobacteriaceae archaeon]
MTKYRVLDASAFIGGFESKDSVNFTVGEITSEVKDIKSKMLLDDLIANNKLNIVEPKKESILELEKIIEKSGDDLRLSGPDSKLLALTLELVNDKISPNKISSNDKEKDADSENTVEIVTDDYSIQNVAKILNIKFRTVLTSGVTEVYSWKKTCEGCKAEYSSDYNREDCDICGSKIFKRRIKNKN